MKIAVIIPCRNERAYIRECIEAIYASQLPANCELRVCIVDGKSDDGTLDVIVDLISQFNNLKLVVNEQQLTPFAFNIGIKSNPDCDFYQIVGARHILSANYINNCLEWLQNDSETWCVGGRIVNEYVNKTGRIIANAMSTSFGMGLGNFRTLEKSGYTDTVTSPMYPKDVFKKIGYFDEELIRNQDDDFNFRVTQAGGKIYYDSSISLRYFVRGNFKGLWKQFFQYGYWKVYVNKKHKSITTIRQLVPPLFVMFLLLLPFTMIVSNVLFLIGCSFLLMYCLIALFVSLRLKRSDKTLSVIGLFNSFPILHISYGLGFLRGIIDFLIFQKRPSIKQTELSR